MRKLFLSMAAVAALLTSCSKDETTTAAVEQRSMVTFTVNAPELSTRADNGDGTTATQLEYVIYDLAEAEGQNQIKGTAEFQNGSLTTTVEVPLVEDRTYKAIFFAQSPEEPYTFDHTAGTMTIKNPDALAANKEEYDAFFKFVNDFVVKPTGTVVDVKMTRPFAQLNIGTNDFGTQAGQMIDADKVQVKVSKVYKTLNLQTGAATDETELTFAFAPKMDGEITASGNDYDWLSMNYLLVNDRATETTAAGTSSKLIDVEFSFTDAPNNNEQSPLTRTYTSVPVERNYRTNIVGSILTSSTKFNVEILPGFEDDKEGVEPLNVWDGETYDEIEADANGWYSVSHAAEFAWILKEKTDNIKISLEADIDFGGHQIPNWGNEATGTHVTLEGNGNTIYNFKNTSEVSRTTTSQCAGLFEFVKGAKVSNLTIEGAEVDAGSASEDAYAGVLFGVAYGSVEINNVTVQNSSVAGVNKVGGLIGFAAADGTALNIDNVKVINPTITTHKMDSESGSAGGFIGIINKISNGYTAVIKNSSVVGGTFNVDNSEDSAKRANSQFIGTVNSGRVELINCSVDTTNLTWDETGVNTYNSPYGELVGGNRGTATVIIDGVAFNASADGDITVEDEGESASVVATSDSLVEALENGENVYLTDDIKIDPAGMSNAYGKTGINVKNGQTINGNGNTLDIKGAGGTWDSGINTTGGLIKNITVTGSFRGIFINHNSTHSEKVVLENVTIEGTTYTISCDQGMNQGLEAYNSTFKGWTSFAATLGTAKFDGCYFGEGNGYAYCRPYAPTEFVGCEFEAGFELDAHATVTFENCTLDGKPLTAENLATLVTSNISNATVK